MIDEYYWEHYIMDTVAGTLIDEIRIGFGDTAAMWLEDSIRDELREITDTLLNFGTDEEAKKYWKDQGWERIRLYIRRLLDEYFQDLETLKQGQLE